MTSPLHALGRFADPAILILTSLSDGDRHGYALLEDIRRATGIKLSPGTLYGALARLENRQLIQALPSDDRRHPYRLTPVGREALHTYLSDLQRLTALGLRRLGEPI